MAHVEKIMGAEFGSTKNPLFVSCRSGARESMPGMMDTVLNIGLNEKTLEALARSRKTSVSPGTAIAVSCRCTATSSST